MLCKISSAFWGAKGPARVCRVKRLLVIDDPVVQFESAAGASYSIRKSDPRWEGFVAEAELRTEGQGDEPPDAEA